MAKSISRILATLAIFGAVSAFVSGSSYAPKGNWPYITYSTTQPPPGLSSSTTTTPAPESLSSSEIRNEVNDLANRFVIISDPKTGSVIYLPADMFWARFGQNTLRQKRSTNLWRNSRAFNVQQPRLHLDEVPQIDDVVENDEYDEKFSDYLRSGSQYQPQVYYDDNIAISAEDQPVQVEVNHKDVPAWQPSEVFKAFFPNYRYNPNKIIYTYSSICSNGCMNNKKYYNAPADNIVLSSTTTSTTTTTTTTEVPSSIEDTATTENTTDIESETTIVPAQSPDYRDDQGSHVPPK